ncbi:MAG: hypothetical protein JSR27_06350 [Proteobacteria bacterium]|nr:hypothetical protein [Pseudomonadota bacterium]
MTISMQFACHDFASFLQTLLETEGSKIGNTLIFGRWSHSCWLNTMAEDPFNAVNTGRTVQSPAIDSGRAAFTRAMVNCGTILAAENLGQATSP